MHTNSAQKAQAFIDYALDYEGMKFHAQRSPNGNWTIIPELGTNYDRQCISAVWRNFNEDWKGMENWRNI